MSLFDPKGFAYQGILIFHCINTTGCLRRPKSLQKTFVAMTKADEQWGRWSKKLATWIAWSLQVIQPSMQRPMNVQCQTRQRQRWRWRNSCIRLRFSISLSTWKSPTLLLMATGFMVISRGSWKGCVHSHPAERSFVRCWPNFVPPNCPEKLMCSYV